MEINKYGGIVLCAGLSSRFSAWKPSVLIENVPMVFHSVRPMLKVCDKVILVGGYNVERLRTMFKENSIFSNDELRKILIVENPEFESGMFSSVRYGLMELGEGFSGAFIVPGDMPAIKEETYFYIKNISESTRSDVIIPAINNSDKSLSSGENINQKIIKGHPILINNKIIEKIRTENEDTTLRDVIRPYDQKIIIVDDKGITLDVDNEGDYKKVLAYFSSKENQE